MNKIDVTPELLAELKEKAGKATKGNWFSTCDNLLQPVVNCVALDRYENRIATFEDSPYSEKDADFIASANPTVILALITKIEQLEKEADWLAEQASMMCDCIENCDECRLFFDCGCNGLNTREVWRNAAKDWIKDNEQSDK